MESSLHFGIFKKLKIQFVKSDMIYSPNNWILFLGFLVIHFTKRESLSYAGVLQVLGVLKRNSLFLVNVF